MTFATSTVTAAEAVTLTIACEKLVKALQEIYSGQCPPNAPMRNTVAELDTMVAAVTAAITAANA